MNPNLGFDGGVLGHSAPMAEILFQYVPGNDFVIGGYNRTISTDRGSPIAGLQAWSGNSGGFVTRRGKPEPVFSQTSTGFAGGWPVIPVAPAKAGALTRSMLWGAKEIIVVHTDTKPPGTTTPTPTVEPDSNTKTTATATATVTPTATATATSTPRPTPTARPRATPRPRPTPPPSP